MAKCQYHIYDQVQENGALADDARHACEEHYVSWRDGDRSGPAHVDGAAACKSACDGCKEELAAAKAAKAGDG